MENKIREFVKMVQDEFPEINLEYLDFAATRFIESQPPSSKDVKTGEDKAKQHSRSIELLKKYLSETPKDEQEALFEKFKTIGIEIEDEDMAASQFNPPSGGAITDWDKIIDENLGLMFKDYLQDDDLIHHYKGVVREMILDARKQPSGGGSKEVAKRLREIAELLNDNDLFDSEAYIITLASNIEQGKY